MKGLSVVTPNADVASQGVAVPHGTIEAPVWDIDISKRLRHGDSRFDLEFHCRSDARRLALFGPSGAGKSQTLQAIAGLVRPDRGHIRVLGQTLHDSEAAVHLSPQARRLAYVFQDYALFPHLTVRQNVAFSLQGGWCNPPRRAAADAVSAWLENFELLAVEHHLPHQLSGGQRQRTALARVLVMQPRALLLDEPFAALDRTLRDRLRDELAALQQRLAIPMLLITHDEHDLRSLADEVVHLADGRVVAGPS